MNWDVHVYRTRDDKWAARVGKWRSNRYPYLLSCLAAVSFVVMDDWSRRRP